MIIKVLVIITIFSLFSFSMESKFELATFAGGCFWCMESPFEKLDGVIEVISGYSGGDEVNPKYKDVASGKTGHVEAIQIKYDPAKISYEKLVEVFWRQIDPTDSGGQFVDRGFQYSTAIFYHNEEQMEIAEKSKKKLGNSKRFKEPIVTRIEKFKSFYPAENYHQDFYKKSSFRYKFYRMGSGRDQFLDRYWKDKDKE